MKKRVLPLMLALLVLLGGCGLSIPAPTPAPTPELTPAPPQATAELQVFQQSHDSVPADEDEAEEGDAEAEALPPEEEAEPAPVVTPAPAAAAIAENTAVRDLELVRVRNYIPDLLIDLKYATTDNFTGKVVYSFDEPYLRCGTVKKLAAAKAMLEQQGYELLLWDAYRPNEAQFELFDAFPNGVYVANPYGGGHSSHTSGGAVDVALMKDGTLCEMPSGFDEFSALGDRNYNDVSEEAAANAKLLEQVMVACGFSTYFGEWWHYIDSTGYNYTDVEGCVLPEHATTVYESECNEYINIRRVANPSAEAIGNIPDGRQMTVLSYLTDFIHIQYGELTGYVNVHYTKPVY